MLHGASPDEAVSARGPIAKSDTGPTLKSSKEHDFYRAKNSILLEFLEKDKVFLLFFLNNTNLSGASGRYERDQSIIFGNFEDSLTASAYCFFSPATQQEVMPYAWSARIRFSVAAQQSSR